MKGSSHMVIFSTDYAHFKDEEIEAQQGELRCILCKGRILLFQSPAQCQAHDRCSLNGY